MKVKILRVKILLPVVLVALLVSAGAAIYVERSSPRQSADVKDRLSEKYELWSIHITGEHAHPTCKGKFQDDYAVRVLIEGSLSKLLAVAPRPQAQILEAPGIYWGTEQVLVRPSHSRATLGAAFTENTPVKFKATWGLRANVRSLTFELESKLPLLLSLCANKSKFVSTPDLGMLLTATDFTPDAIRGSWSGSATSVTNGVFVLKWEAGGASGRPIPGPTDIKVAPGKIEGSLFVSWREVPRAEHYDVYYSVGDKILAEPGKLFHIRTERPFANGEIKDPAAPTTFAVSATIDGQETKRSGTATAPGPASAPVNKTMPNATH